MRKSRSALRNHFELLSYRLARVSAGRATPGFQDRLGSLLGIVFHQIARRRKNILDFNLALAYPELSVRERILLGRAVARHFGRALLGSLHLQNMKPEELIRSVRVEGLEILQAAAQSGKGFFVLSAHLGAWEAGALRMGLEIPDGLSVIGRPLDNDLLDRELEGFRKLFGNRVLNKRGAARHMISTLRKGGAVGILIDQRANQAGAIEVPFFGHPARSHTVLAAMVLRTGAKVVPTWTYAEGKGRYFLKIEEPAPLESGDDLVSLTTRYTVVTEAAIRRRPEQWLWYHDRWREIRRQSDGGKAALPSNSG